MKNSHGGDIYGQKVTLDFSVSINPLGMPESVIEAAKKGVECSECYPDVDCRELIKAIAEYEQISPDHVICGNGAADLIVQLCMAVRPRKALLVEPTFSLYEEALQAVGCQVETVSLWEEHDFAADRDFIERLIGQIDSATDIVFLCNPNNPTGQLISSSGMEELIEVCRENQCRVVIDECFIELSDCNGQYNPPKQNSHVFILKAFTKTYAMPGLRLGYGITTDRDLILQMKSLIQPWNVSVPAQMAGVAALREKEYLQKSRQYIKEQREYLLRELSDGPIRKVYPSDVNFILFQSDAGLQRSLLKRGILIRDCSNFRGLSEGFYRIAVRREEENRQLIKGMKELLWQK